MSRIVQGAKSRGSQRWLQIAVNRCPRVIDRAIRDAGIELPGAIEWLSPLEGDGFAEYQDAAFLERLGIRLDRRALGGFWPARGPVWDGLARSGERLLLVEAKAHAGEIDSSPTAAGRDSRAMIEAALAETRAFLGVGSDSDWTRCFYQYANRLAHLYLLRELNGLDAWLLFVYFTGDDTMGRQASREDWECAVALAKARLGLQKSGWLSSHVRDIYVDTGGMRAVAWPPRSGPGVSE